MPRVILGAQYVGETVNQVFDFASRLAVGETISSASASYTCYAGATGSTITLGSAASSGTKVTVPVSGGTLGVTYLLTVSIVTSLSQTLSLSGFLTVVQGAN